MSLKSTCIMKLDAGYKLQVFTFELFHHLTAAFILSFLCNCSVSRLWMFTLMFTLMFTMMFTLMMCVYQTNERLSILMLSVISSSRERRPLE